MDTGVHSIPLASPPKKSRWPSKVSIALLLSAAALWFVLIMFKNIAPGLAVDARFNIFFILASIAAIALPIEGIIWGASAFLVRFHFIGRFSDRIARNSDAIRSNRAGSLAAILSVILVIASVPLCFGAYYALGAIHSADPAVAAAILGVAILTPFASHCSAIYAVCTRASLRWLAAICAILTGLFFAFLLLALMSCVPP
jgi:hypothetical protein